MGRLKGSRTGHYTLVHFTCERCGKPFSRRPSAAVGAKYCSMDCYKPKRELLTCERCGKRYPWHAARKGRFCSQLCQRNRVQKTCPGCGVEFEVKASKSHKFTYCSIECRRNACARLHTEATCETCGKSFEIYVARDGTARYCSRECHNEAGRTTIVCAHCGASKVVKKYRAQEGVRFCSNRCSVRYRLEHGGGNAYVCKKRQSGYRTDIERLTERALLGLGIPYIFEHKVSRYSVDFALPSLQIALECDGWHHSTERGQERDIARDAALRERGWRPVHLRDCDIRLDAVHCVAAALALLPETGHSA